MKKSLERYLSSDVFTKEAIEITKSIFPNQRLHLVGGSVYRPIAHRLHGVPIPETDVDILVPPHEERSGMNFPKGWKVDTEFIHPTGEYSFGYSFAACKEGVPDRHLDVFDASGLANPLLPENHITSYLKSVSLNVQSIAYDLTRGRLVGKVGINALKEGIVKVNNPDMLIYTCKKTGINPRDYIAQKAESLQFACDFSGI